MFQKSLHVFYLLMVFTCTGFAQTAIFKYQYENQQARAGHFSFICPQDPTLSFEADASAGYLGGSNNPYLQATANIGPIPNGTWTITAIKSESKAILRLSPGDDVAITFRNGFLIHGLGDGLSPAESSTGCIILSKDYRLKLLKAFKAYGTVTISVTNFTTSDNHPQG